MKNKIKLMLFAVMTALLFAGCSVELSGLNLQTVDTLKDVTQGIVNARTQYVTVATDYLQERGVAVAFDVDTEDTSSVNLDALYTDPESLANMGVLARSVLISTFRGGVPVSGSATANVTANVTDEGTTKGEITYNFFYSDWGSLQCKERGAPDTDTNWKKPLEGEGWVLMLDMGSGKQVSATEISEVLGVEASDTKGGNWFKVEMKSCDLEWGSDLCIVWGDSNKEWAIAEGARGWSPTNTDPENERVSAFGTGSINSYALATSGSTRDLLPVLRALGSPSTVLAPTNPELTDNGEEGQWVEGFINDPKTGYYMRKGSIENAENYVLTSWDGSGGNKVSPGYEVLSSAQVDYGRIYVLDPEAEVGTICEVQKKLYSFFGAGDTANVITASSASGSLASELSGTGALNCFKETQICMIPPGFGILSYSMIPRKGLVATGTLDATALGQVVCVKGVDGGVSVGLGFIGPNPTVLEAMDRVLGTASGGFAVINEHIYLMAYPVAVVNYLYTNAAKDRAYIGLGTAPVYYNLIYDRLDYKFGTEYQFQTSAEVGVSDENLYGDYNFVGGIASRDSTGVDASTGGVCLLYDDAGKSTTMRVQIAAKENIDAAKEMFVGLVNDYYVRPVPISDALDDSEWREELRKTLIVDDKKGTAYFNKELFSGDDDRYIEKWAKSLKTSYLEVPQFILLDYVETALLPDAAGDNDAVVTGRKIRLMQSAIQYDKESHLFYFNGSTSTQIGNYISMDGTRELDTLFLGDVVDVRALSGVGYSTQAGGEWEEVQPPYGYNMMFPIGIKTEDYAEMYTNDISEMKAEGSGLEAEGAALENWCTNVAHISGSSITDFGSMSHWDGEKGFLGESTYYQAVSAANNVGTLTFTVQDEDGGSVEATSVVAALAVKGAEDKVHLGETDVTLDTTIDELPYVPTDIITFSEPFPNTIYNRTDAASVYEADTAPNGAAVPNVMYTMAVGTGITHGNFYHAWVASEAPTDSLTWWNNYLQEHHFEYRVNPQVVQQYLETNYSYLANADNRLRFDLNAVKYWSEEIDTLNPNRGGSRIVNGIMTASNVLGWALVFYAVICILLWAVDIYGGLDKDFYRMVTGGRYVASAESMPSTANTHYATFLNALSRSVVLCIAGAVLIFVGAGVILAKMFRFLALILRLVSGNWKVG